MASRTLPKRLLRQQCTVKNDMGEHTRPRWHDTTLSRVRFEQTIEGARRGVSGDTEEGGLTLWLAPEATEGGEYVEDHLFAGVEGTYTLRPGDRIEADGHTYRVMAVHRRIGRSGRLHHIEAKGSEV